MKNQRSKETLGCRTKRQQTTFSDEGCLLMFAVCQQVYHISRNLWSRLETRTVKNVCAPAAVIEDKIYIVGGKLKISCFPEPFHSFILQMQGQVTENITKSKS